MNRLFAVGPDDRRDMMAIREYAPDDWPTLWGVLEPIFRAGETYVFAPDISEQEARHVWIETPSRTFVATQGEHIVGSYYLKSNYPGLADHICNCGYVVSESARRQGIASRMCEHSQQVAVSMGFFAMQYNFVVATNTQAINLWTRHGFEIVGRIPNAFRHPRHSFVDALIMYKSLEGG